MEEGLFKFISDEQLRKQCTQDLEEFLSCYNAKAYKASIVLIGSLIEAVLYYYLNHNEDIKSCIDGFEKRELKLKDLLFFAKQHDVIGEELYKLADQIRDFRNFIHPKVALRTKTEITNNTVQIGYSVLLEIVRVINSRLKRDKQNNAVEVITNIVSSTLGRLPTAAELFLYSPILAKYGKKGEAVIVENLKRGRAQ